MDTPIKKVTVALWAALLLCCCHERTAGLADYHEALALMDNGDAPTALDKLEQAEKKATTDSLFALIYSQMGTLYFNQHMLDRSLVCYQKAYDIDQQAGDTVGLIYDLRDIGNVLRAGEYEDSCMFFFCQARTLAIASQNSSMQRDVESQMAAYYLRKNQLDSARLLLLPVLEYRDCSNQSALHFMMADLYHRNKQPDSATLYYNKVLEHGTLHARMGAHRVLAEYAMNNGNQEQAQEHLRQYELLTDSVLAANDSEALRRMTTLYDYSRHEQLATRLHTRLILAVAIIMVLALLLLALFFYQGRRKTLYLLKVTQLEQLLEKKREQEKSQQQKLMDSPICHHINSLLSEVSQPVMGNEDWHALEDTITSFYPDFLDRLQDFCRLSSMERHVCLLIRLGISPASIAQLTAHSKQAITNLRSRLYQKTFGKKGTPAQWDEFIRSL